MRNIILITIAAVITMAHSGNCQVDGADLREKLGFGLKLGGNYSNVYDSRGEEFVASGKAGFAGGFFLSVPIGRYIGVQPEVLFSQKGFQATGSILGNAYDFTRTTSHIEVPLLFAVKPVSFLSILAGPQFSRLIRRKDVFANGITTIEQEEEFGNDSIRKNTLGFVGGVDINIFRFVVGARAGWDALYNRGDGTSETPRYKDTWFQGTIGYRF